MKLRLLGAALLLVFTSSLALATEADDTTITIMGQNAGPTSLIVQLSLSASQTTVIRSIGFTISPKPGSVTRPLSGSFSHDYLAARGNLDANTGDIFLPVYGLYANFVNTVTLTYFFTDGSSSNATTSITAGNFADSCNHATPTKILPRTNSTALSYDYFLVRGACSVSPVIIDTDGEVRWISPFNTHLIIGSSSTFFDNAVYVTRDTQLYRVDLDGTVTSLADYSSYGVELFHHNIDPGKVGLILDADTNNFTESANLEVDAAGNVLKTWNMAHIISAAMVAGGDDPDQFVFEQPTDWFHNNAVAYRRSDDTLIVSGREDFVIGLDYDSLKIKWILGDETKKWFEFPSLAQFSLALAPGGLPPIGQHAVSVTVDNNLLLMDNGRNSIFQMPPGIDRKPSQPRKYALDVSALTATELNAYPGDEGIYTQFCGSSYEDAKSNFLTDYAFVTIADGMVAHILGYDATGAKVFHYMYESGGCGTAYNSLPIHLESTRFPAVGPQALNISTRANVGTDDDALIAGFIVTGTTPKTVVLRAIGPSLSEAGVTGALADPMINVINSSGILIGSNDNWETDAGAAAIRSARLDPTDPLEAATVLTLAPGAYTAVVIGQNRSTGVGLVEAYDLSPAAGSILANISARGVVGTGDDALISGFIVGDVGTSTVVVRALGPSLPANNVSQPLSDPTLSVFDGNGTEIGTNDNWQDDPTASAVAANGLAPANDAESALLLNLPAGSYTAVVNGVDAGTGVGLVEVYNLH